MRIVIKDGQLTYYFESIILLQFIAISLASKSFSPYFYFPAIQTSWEEPPRACHYQDDILRLNGLSIWETLHFELLNFLKNLKTSIMKFSNAFTRNEPFLALNYLFLFFLFGYLKIQAQPCTPIAITLGTQAEVDSFQFTYGGCNEVLGTLTIEGADIQNLAGLQGLTKVTSLVIRNCPILANLDGLDNLDTIDAGQLILDNLPVISNIDGLAGLSTMHVQALTLRDLPLLEDINALSNISDASISTSGTLGIGNVDAVLTVDLSNFSIPELRAFNVFANDTLTSLLLPGFIAFDGRGCFVDGNPNLQNVDLSGLTTVVDELSTGLFFRNNALHSLNLSSLQSASGLRIENELFLSDLSSLQNLHTLDGSGLTLRNLPLLSDINWLSNLMIFEGFYLILNNLPLIPDINPLMDLPSPSITTGGKVTLRDVELITTADLSNFGAPELSLLDISHNGTLRNFAMPGLLSFDGRPCYIWDNPNLDTLDLSGLTTVNDHLVQGLSIRSNGLTHVDLSSLSAANGLRIENEPYLPDLSSLGSLHTLTGTGLILRDIPQLINLDGLSSLMNFDGQFLLLRNLPLIPDLDPLKNLSSASIGIGGQVGIFNVDAVPTVDLSKFSAPELSIFNVLENDSLTSFLFPGFITFDGRGCFIIDNPKLQTVDLSGLTMVVDELTTGLFFRANSLHSLDLSSLIDVSSLRIENEPVLSNLNGIPNLISVSDNLKIQGNPNLCDCSAISPLVDGNDDGASGPGSGNIPDVFGPVVIENNFSGCNNITEILSGATQLVCYLDADGDTFGDPEVSATFCGSCGTGYVLNDTDCDDTGPNQNPGMTEVCDGIDNNCDGNIDEGFDKDGDGICDSEDNCPQISNPDQADADQDGQGDVCDSCPLDAGNDFDGDGVCSDIDNCPDVVNGNQLDSDGDGIGDACDICPIADPNNDLDQDGICGNDDNCPTVANADQLDSDGDGIGDICDTCPLDSFNDIDGDGICGEIDNCPFTANPDQLDNDTDGVGDVCDDSFDDEDEDGIPDASDNCPEDPNADQMDSDCDTVGDACDKCPGGDDRIDTYGDPTIPDCAEFDKDNIPVEFQCGNDKVLVCHVPNGNPSNAHNICISDKAVQKHLGHGDYLGNCHEVACSPGALQNLPGTSFNLEQEQQALELLLYPNPATNRVSFTIRGGTEGKPFQYEIFNQMGQRVYKGKVEEGENNLQEIDLVANGFAKGSYLLVVDISGTKLYAKFIVLDRK